MIEITEKKYGNESYYEKKILVNGSSVVNDLIRVRAVVLKRQNKNYYLIYDSNMEINSSFFAYINRVLEDKAENTQIKTHVALKFLLVFEEIIGKTLKEFLPEDIVSLKYFLHGYSNQGQEFSFNFLTTRSNETVNGYLAVYRGYLQYLGIEQHPLFHATGRLSRARKSSEDLPIKTINYRANDRTPKKLVEVPKYISVDEFIRILEYVREKYDLMTEIIIRLMFQCGLRIGEVLGLTADDLVMEDVNSLPSRIFYEHSEKYVPIAYIRNRVSDAKYQNAKSCMKVISPKQYFTEEYALYGYGYQFVVIPQDLFNLIDEYIENAHVEAREKSADRYYNKTIADRVRLSEELEDDNYYVFINSIGTPLSLSSWNSRLRDIFTAVGIPIDKDKRKNNLNHRFRHGFAMFNIQYCHANATKVADLLRHSSINSVMCYFNPTISDQIELKNKAIEDMYAVIPELKRKE